MCKNLKSLNKLKYYDVTSNNPLFIRLEEPKVEKLYHYTSNLNANSILNNNCLWVTRSDYLDDNIEIKYICKVLNGAILYLQKNKKLYDVGFKGQDLIFRAVINTLVALNSIYEKTTPIFDAHIYILSLTENKDNMYLLDNYAGKNGAILEFLNKPNYIFENDELKKSKSLILCAKVIYDYGEQLTLLLKEINEFYIELINNLENTNWLNDLEEVVETIKSVIYIKIINYSLFFKHKDFSREEECRIAFIVDDEFKNNLIKNRKRGNDNIPYIEVSFNKEGLNYIYYK